MDRADEITRETIKRLDDQGCDRHCDETCAARLILAAALRAYGEEAVSGMRELCVPLVRSKRGAWFGNSCEALAQEMEAIPLSSVAEEPAKCQTCNGHGLIVPASNRGPDDIPDPVLCPQCGGVKGDK